MHMGIDPGANQQIAARLGEAAEILEQQGANPFRVAAYRRAAQTVAGLDVDLRDLLEGGDVARLLELPGVGRGIATAIEELVRTGCWAQLERLRGTLDPVRLFQTIPGVGPRLARRLHDELQVDTLQALEVAAHDGRLEGVPGIGPRRAASIRALLGSMLGRVRRLRGPAPGSGPGPGVALLLEVDREYRERAAVGALPTIAPRRFNPAGEAWLPILHCHRGGWNFTALYSNTVRAHELSRTRDWVVVYFYDNDHREGQYTVVTETRGAMSGRRVVRGREAECRALYAA